MPALDTGFCPRLSPESWLLKALNNPRTGGLGANYTMLFKRGNGVLGQAQKLPINLAVVLAQRWSRPLDLARSSRHIPRYSWVLPRAYLGMVDGDKRSPVGVMRVFQQVRASQNRAGWNAKFLQPLG